MTDTLIVPLTSGPDLESEDRATHIVGPDCDETGRVIKQGVTKVTEARILGTPVTALCGYTWVPTHDPNNYPVCEGCKQIAQTGGRINDDNVRGA